MEVEKGVIGANWLALLWMNATMGEKEVDPIWWLCVSMLWRFE